jgi:hypothetical protein
VLFVIQNIYVKIFDVNGHYVNCSNKILDWIGLDHLILLSFGRLRGWEYCHQLGVLAVLVDGLHAAYNEQIKSQLERAVAVKLSDEEMASWSGPC